jgi:hypothetical protein
VFIVRTEARVARDTTNQDLWLRLHAFSGTGWDALPWNVDRLKRQEHELAGLIARVQARVERQNRPTLTTRIQTAVQARRKARTTLTAAVRVPAITGGPAPVISVDGRDVQAWWKQ